MPSYTASIPSERPDHVEPGDYEVEVVNAIEATSKGGHDMIELKLKTSAGSHLYDFLVFIPSAYWKIDAFRAATGENVTPEQDVEITGDSLIGRTGTARLTVEEYNGKKRNKVAAWIIGDAKPTAQPQPARRNDNNPF